jgi:DNA-binding MarR family transcriptional regulator
MDDALKLKSQVCFPIYALSREIINTYRPFLDELGITYPQYLVLLVLWEKGPQTVNQIGLRLNLDSGTLTPLLKRLQAKGLISRKRKSCDERLVEISLTPDGQDLQTEAAMVPPKVMEAMNITAGELQELKEVVTKILDKQRKTI